LKISVISTTTYATPPISYGGEIFFWNLAEALAQLGHEVHLYAAPGSKCPTNGFLHYIKGSYGAIDLQAEHEVYEVYKDEILSSDFIIECSHDHLVAEQIYWFRKEHAHKVFNVLNGVVTIWPRCKPWNMIVGSNKWKELVVNAITQFKGTPWEKSQYDIPLPNRIEEKECHVIPWAINTDFYCPNPEEPYEKEDYFLWVGRLTPYKGFHTVLRLAEELKLHIKVLGSVEILEHQYYRQKYKEDAQKAIDAGAQIEFVEESAPFGHEQKRDLYRKAKALIFPVESHEPFGLVVIEALACGTPVITSTFGAMPEIVERSSTGFLCESLEEYGHAIDLIETIKLENCREDAVSRFDRKIAAQMYLDLYKRLSK